MSVKRKPKEPVKKPPAIMIVPDKTYINDEGLVTTTDVILITDLSIYSKMRMSLADMEKRKDNDKKKL